MARRSAAVVPLGRDAPSRFLPWIFALMVYLAVLALTGVLILHAAVERWQRGEVDTLTVQIMPLENDSEEARMAKLRELLGDVEGVSGFRTVAQTETIYLIERWLGAGNVPADLPLPRLIDVDIAPGYGLDAETLALRLQASLAGVTVDDAKQWLDRLADFGRSLELLAVAVVILIGLATVATVVFTTRMGISIHRNVIELLHLIGARDGYVAVQFQRQAMMLGLRGGVLGIIFAVATLYGLRHVAGRLETPLAPDIPVAHWAWGLLAAVPVVTAVIAMVTARLTALRELAKMP
ncbi:MAG: cell division protein [Alphaproteobacteria bacterium]|jgi:cell division transport system permease protein|nr:cell division protein [Alphaproteobacteria bacterium]MDP7642461.1 cell division protein [Alphaproteobacteria bacterium]